MPITRPPSLGAPPEEPSIGEQIGGGLLVGAHRDPIMALAMDQINKHFVGADPEIFSQLEMRLAGSRISDVAEIVGQFGPQLALGAGAYALGRAAMTSALGALAPRLAIASTAAKLADSAEALVPLAKPIVLRAAELTGGAIGSGAFSAAEAKAAGADTSDVVKAGLIGTALSAGIEGTLIGVGKLISPAAREVDPTAAIARFTQVGQEQGRTIGALRAGVTRARKQLADLNDVLQTTESADDWERAFHRATQLERAIGARTNKIEAFKKFLDPESIIPSSILRTEPAQIGRESTRELSEKLFTNVVQTPQGLAQKLGVSGVRLMQIGEEAEADAFIATRANSVLFDKFVRRVATAMGKKLPKNLEGHMDKVDDLLAGPWNLAEQRVGGGLAAVRAQYGDDVANAFGELSDDLFKTYKPLADRGAAPFLRPDELGDGIYLPHVIADQPIAELEKRMIAGMEARGVAPGTARANVAKILADGPQGVVKFGSIDHMRINPGTLAEKIEAGMPFNGPGTGLLRYLNAVATRRAYAERFGINNELREMIVGTAAREGANPNLVANLFDHLVGAQYYPRAARRAAQSITSLQSGTKLVFAPIANATQGVNNAIFGGVKNAARGVWAALRGGDPALSAKAASVLESEFNTMNRIMAGVDDSNVLDRFAHGVLRRSGFSMTERFNRMSGAATTIFNIEDTVAKALAGKLRGNTLDAARRRFASIHLDLGKIVQKAKELKVANVPGNSLAAEAIDLVHGLGAHDKAVFFGTRLSQFVPTRSRTPFLWSTPHGRILFQFKNFALQQGAFIKDQVIAEAARGNLRPLATFAGFYPLAGEIVGTTLATLKDRDRPTDGLTRLVEDLSMVGGFGLVQSMVSAAQYGRMKDFFLGPTLTDATSFAEAALQGNLEGLTKQLLRQPLAVATKRIAEGTATGIDHLMEYAEQDSDSGGEVAIPIRELR